MVLKLYGHSISLATRLVALILQEKQVPFEFCVVNFFGGEHKTPEFAKQHPFNRIPYIDDDGFILYESRAIAYYIAAKYADQGTPLIPTDLRGLALLHQALSVELSYFNGDAERAIYEGIVNPMNGIPTRPAELENIFRNLSANLDIYDGILGKQRYLAGDAITLADLAHLPLGSNLAAAGKDVISSRPNVNRWFNEMTSRPAWKAVEGDITTDLYSAE